MFSVTHVEQYHTSVQLRSTCPVGVQVVTADVFITITSRRTAKCDYFAAKCIVPLSLGAGDLIGLHSWAESSKAYYQM